jgi:hypothetical protein
VGAGLLTLLASGLLEAFSVGLGHLTGATLAVSPWQAIAELAGLAVIVAIVAAVLRLWRTPIDDFSAATPASSYREDRRAARVVGLLVGLASALVIGLISGLNAALVLTPETNPLPRLDVVRLGLTQGPAFGLVFGLAAWAATGRAPQVRLLQLSLRLRGHGRVRFIPLLEDALNRQVLRQSGTMHQFRHAALQDYFAAQARRAT